MIFGLNKNTIQYNTVHGTHYLGERLASKTSHFTLEEFLVLTEYKGWVDTNGNPDAL
jgi:hypothetical protein